MQQRTRQYPQYQPSTPPRTHRRGLWDRTWKDQNGTVTLWQRPNAWLIGWAALTTLSLLFTRRPADIISAVASISLIVWALLEIFRGINYYRRFLGAIVLIYALAAILKSL